MWITSIFSVVVVCVVVADVEGCVCGVAIVRSICSAWVVLGRGARCGVWGGGNGEEWMLFCFGDVPAVKAHGYYECAVWHPLIAIVCEGFFVSPSPNARIRLCSLCV